MKTENSQNFKLAIADIPEDTKGEETSKARDVRGDYVIAIKLRKSGLSENSWGDGRNSSTVSHGIAVKPIKTGRITRQPGQFLCGTKEGWGTSCKAIADQPTCPKCLKLVNRASLKPCEDWAIANKYSY